jgi:hypothetical protein
MLVDEHRDIVADIEDEPDGDEAGDAVTVNLQEISNNVSIEKSHWIAEFQLLSSDLQHDFGHQATVIPSDARNL